MIPQFPQFKELELVDKEEIERFTSKYPPYSDFNFISMWSWDVNKDMRISKLNNNLVVRFTDYLTGIPFFSFLGGNMVNETALALLEFSKKEGLNAELKLIPEEVVKNLDSKKFTIIEDRANFDYIYNIKDLSEYEGRKLSMHRNLVNRFLKNYASFEVKNLPLKIIENEILELTENWMKDKIDRGHEISLRNESRSIKRIFDFKNSNLSATCVFYEGKLIAYSIVEVINKDFTLCHFSKANVKYSGIYSFLMKKNCEILLSFGQKFLNYEQDLGLLNLRSSKDAFKPERFLNKFVITES